MRYDPDQWILFCRTQISGFGKRKLNPETEVECACSKLLAEESTNKTNQS